MRQLPFDLPIAADDPRLTGNLAHDQELCLRVARLLSADRRGHGLTVVDLPDVRERSAKAVELLVNDSMGGMAFEHTPD